MAQGQDGHGTVSDGADKPGGVHFRVWAPERRHVDVVFYDGHERTVRLQWESNGYHSGLAEGVSAGASYKYRLDGGDDYPDPFSRFQPQGPHNPSAVVDPGTF